MAMQHPMLFDFRVVSNRQWTAIWYLRPHKVVCNADWRAASVPASGSAVRRSYPGLL